LIKRLEGPVVVAGFRPCDATSAGNVPAALARLRQAGRRKNLTSEFRTTANVYKFHSTLTHSCLDLRQERSNGKVGIGSSVSCRRNLGGFVGQLAPFRQQLFPASIDDANVGMTVDLEL